jgi:hypothetical protein
MPYVRHTHHCARAEGPTSCADAGSTRFFKSLPYRLMADRLDYRHGHGAVGQQSERPSGMPCGWLTAPERYQPGFPRSIQEGRTGGMVLFLSVEGGPSPCSTQRCLPLSTVWTLTEKLPAILASVQAGHAASAFNRIWACLSLYADAFPCRVSSANWRRSSSERRTMYFLFMAHSV